MEQLFEIAKYTIPALVVFATAYVLIKTLVENERKRYELQYRIENKKIALPVRFMAFERVALFLERISPESLVLRTQKSDMDAKLLQSMLLATIRSEYEHNLSQQVYVSSATWNAVRIAKENIVKLVNTAGDQVPADAPAFDLSKKILEMYMQVEESPLQTALEILKMDMKHFF